MNTKRRLFLLGALLGSVILSIGTALYLSFGTNRLERRLEKALKVSEYPVFAVRFSPDGKLIASGSGDGLIKIWDAQSYQLSSMLPDHSGFITALDFAAGSDQIISMSQKEADGQLVNTYKVWDVLSAKELRAPDGVEKVFANGVLSPNGKYRAKLKSDYLIVIERTDGSGAECLLATDGHAVNCIKFSPDGRIVAAGTGSTSGGGPPVGPDGVGEVRIWDLDTCEEIGRFRWRWAGAISSLDFAPDNRRLVSGSYDGYIQIWSLRASDK